jgi:hypothetical protein
MPYIGNVTTSSNVNGSQINNGTITGEKLSLPFNYDSATLYLDDTNNRVGILTASPGYSLTVGTGGIVSIPAATAAAPSLIFGTNSGTGLYSPGADQVAISTGGSGRLFVDSSGRVGVGSSSPTSPGGIAKFLQISDASSASIVLSRTAATASQLEISTYGSANLIQSFNAPLLFDMGSGEKMRLDTSGRLGIGNSSPGAKLDISGSGNLVRLGDGTNTFDVRFQGPNNWATELNTSTDTFNIKRNTSTFVTVDSIGRLGIGTNSPSFNLDVSGGAGNGIRYLNTTNSIGVIIGSDATSAQVGSVSSHPVQFLVGSVERARIDTSGRVGIGTTSPQGPLHVENVTGSNTVRMVGGSSQSSVIAFYNNAATTNRFIVGQGYTSGSDNIGFVVNGANADLAFGTNNTERARIDSSGRLLVGTSTARASAGITGHFQIEGTTFNNSSINLTNNVNSNQCSYLVFGKSRSGTIGGSTVVQNGDLLGYIQFAGADGTDLESVGADIAAYVDGTPGTNDMPGRLVFSTTADGAATPTERMRITNGGILNLNGQRTGFSAIMSGSGNVRVASASGGGVAISTFDIQDYTPVQFVREVSGSANQVGTITCTSTATAYNTSSDYRLKENVVPLTGAIDRLNDLQVHRFNFIADPDKTIDGFIAHEAQAVVPECVTGTKDELDADGNPVYQGIDQSKLVPLLTAALQEAIGRIEALEADVAPLKGA